MPATTRRPYAQTLTRLALTHGELSLSALDSATLDSFLSAAWTTPATWNRHVATLRSYTAHARRRG